MTSFKQDRHTPIYITYIKAPFESVHVFSVCSDSFEWLTMHAATNNCVCIGTVDDRSH